MVAWLALIVGLIVLAVLLLQLLLAAAQYRAPAAATIKKRLRVFDLNPAEFSPRCINALAAEAGVSTMRFQKLGLNRPDQWSRNLQKHAEAMANQVYATVVGEGECSAERINEAVHDDAAPIAWFILAQHHPKRFGLAALDKTQWTNAMMRSRQAA